MEKGRTGLIASYLFVAVVTSGAFYWLNHLSVSQTNAVLDFYKTVVELFFCNDHYYAEELGYVGSGYTIGEACLGLNILVFLFGVCGLTSIAKTRGYKKIVCLLLSLALAVSVGVFANILRLLGSVYFTAHADFTVIHALLGILIYLAAVIFCHRTVQKITERWRDAQ
ncbi:MAG: exosortase K [Clostridiales bacterium]|jgi:exosortase K|nr:exosortase K [Clostridiales bacterium]